MSYQVSFSVAIPAPHPRQCPHLMACRNYKGGSVFCIVCHFEILHWIFCFYFSIFFHFIPGLVGYTIRISIVWTWTVGLEQIVQIHIDVCLNWWSPLPNPSNLTLALCQLCLFSSHGEHDYYVEWGFSTKSNKKDFGFNTQHRQNNLFPLILPNTSSS